MLQNAVRSSQKLIIPKLTYLGGIFNTTSGAAPFTSITFGPASPSRRLILLCGSSGNDSQPFRVLNGGTIGGITGTVYGVSNRGTVDATGILTAIVPTNDNQELSPSFAGNLEGNGLDLALYQVDGLVSPTPTEVVTDIDGTWDIDVEDGGVALGIFQSNAPSGDFSFTTDATDSGGTFGANFCSAQNLRKYINAAFTTTGTFQSSIVSWR